MTSRKIAAFVLCACLLMIGGVFAQEPEPTPTDTPTLVPTDTATNTDTPSPIPTDTATHTATETSTDTLAPTDTATSTATATAPETTPEVTDPPLVEGPTSTSTPTRTPVDTSGLPTWCYYWNFAAPNANNGGFSLPASVGAGEFVDGQGWVGAVNIALPVKPTINRTLLQIQRIFDDATILTNVDFAYVREEGFVEEDLSSPIETLGIFINFVYPNTFAGAAVQHFSNDSNTITAGTFSWEGILGGVTSVILESQASWAESPTPATGSTRITAATFRGYGANPVALMDNCDTPTCTIIANRGPINVRISPNVNSEMIGQVEYTQPVSAIGITDNGQWFRIRYTVESAIIEGFVIRSNENGDLFDESACLGIQLPNYPDDYAPTLTPTPTPTLTNTPAPTLEPQPCTVLRVSFDFPARFRVPEPPMNPYGWVPVPDEYTNNVAFGIENRSRVNPPPLGTEPYTLLAQEYVHPDGYTGNYFGVVSIVVLQNLGVHPDAPPDPRGQYGLDQRYVWLQVRLSLSDGRVMEGAVALEGPSIPRIFDLSGDCGTILPTATPVPTPTPNYGYISCLYFGVQLPATTAGTNVRDAANTARLFSIPAGTNVFILGRETDPAIQSRINNNQIAAPPSGVIDSIDQAVRELVRLEGWVLIYWDDSINPINPDAARTTNEWWIIGSVVEITFAGTQCPSEIEPTGTPPPPTPPPSDFTPVIANVGHMYGATAPDPNNPAAVMGSRGFHYANSPDPSTAPLATDRAITLDTVPLSVEGCVDDDNCRGNHDPAELIPLFAPVSGCFLTARGSPFAGLQRDVVVLKAASSPSICSSSYPDPIIQISFTHIMPQSDPQAAGLPLGNGSFVAKGTLIGYLCPPNSVGECNLSAPTHMALTMVSERFSSRPPKTNATTADLQAMFLNLHNCFALPLTDGVPVTVNPAPNLCLQYGY